jgi:hypothetical protein
MGEDKMLHWKGKLGILAFAAALLASFLGEGDGFYW